MGGSGSGGHNKKHERTIEDMARIDIDEIKMFWSKLKDHFLRKFKIIAVPWAYGGYRLYLKCPRCGRRVSTLHREPDIPLEFETWACRKCWGLPYQSQREDNLTRAWAKIDRILALLKWERGQTWGIRPKGMRQKTFERLVNELRLAEEAKSKIFVARALPYI